MLTPACVRWTTTAALLALLVMAPRLCAQSGAGTFHEAVTSGLPRYDPSIHEKAEAAKAAAAPKNIPGPVPESEPAKPAAGTNETPAEDAIPLPKVTVRGLTPPKPLPRADVQKPVKELPGEEWESESARQARLVKKHLSVFDRTILNRFTLPLFGISKEARAHEAEAVEAKGRQLNELAAAAEIGTVAGQDPEMVKKIREEFLRIYYSGPSK